MQTVTAEKYFIKKDHVDKAVSYCVNAYSRKNILYVHISVHML